MKKITLWLGMFLCLLTLAGCGGKETGDTAKGGDGTSAGNGTSEGTETPEDANPPERISLTGEYVPVAEFAKAPFIHFYLLYQYIYEDGEIICQSEDADKLLAYASDGSDTSRVLAEADCGEDSRIEAFFIDEEGSLYLYENVFLAPRKFSYYLRKIDREGREAYRMQFGQETEMPPMPTIYADKNGNAALIDHVNWEIYFFDSQGRYQEKVSVPCEGGSFGPPRTVMHCGKNDLIYIDGQYFLWAVEKTDGFLSLWEVDFENCRISKERIINMASFGDLEYKAAHTANGSFRFDGVLFDGGPLGLLISTEDVLWQYDIESGVSTELLRWDETFISIDGRCIWQIDIGETGKHGTAMDVVVYNKTQSSYTYAAPEIASITYVDKAYLKEKQVISIGLDSTAGGIEQTIRRFNRLNNGYEAVLVDYDASMLKDMLSYGEEIPDLLDISSIRTGWLESKNLLEDLTPYFEKSSTLSREDILPAVWELLEGADGKLTGMATGFTIRALATASDLPENGWTYSQLLSLEDQYPGSLYMNQHTPTWVWGLISITGVNDFIDWDTRRCSFDSPEFRSLIEEIKNLNYPPRRRAVTDPDLLLERMTSGQILMKYSGYGAPYDYEHEKEESGGTLKTISFPTADGEPTYIFAPSQSLAIYSESPHKDGAWVFLEFLLNGEEQRWYGVNRDIFPVNADAFYKYLARPNNVRGYIDSVVSSEETQEKICDMVSHLALNQNNADEITSIINEELQAYFAGDKTVAQTAAIIQNRVQLYLDEM